MAASATAIAQPFSPTTATVSQPSGTASAGSTGINFYPESTKSFAITPSGGASGETGGATTQTLSCSSCCVPPVTYLKKWFSPGGFCPGAVDNTAPVQLVATFSMSGYGGYSLADLCLPSSASIDVIANNSLRTESLFVVTPATSCPLASPPTKRFKIKTATAPPYDDLCYIYSNAYVPNGLTFYCIVCDCSTLFSPDNFSQLKFWDQNPFLFRVPMTLLTYSCSPFSITYTGGQIHQGYLRKGSFDITFTL